MSKYFKLSIHTLFFCFFHRLFSLFFFSNQTKYNSFLSHNILNVVWYLINCIYLFFIFHFSSLSGLSEPMSGDDAVTEFQEGLITFRNSAGSKSTKNNLGMRLFLIILNYSNPVHFYLCLFVILSFGSFTSINRVFYFYFHFYIYCLFSSFYRLLF